VNDAQILRGVVAGLTWRARLQPNENAVAVNDGIVSLGGWVDSYAKSWGWLRGCKKIRGNR
jgi:hypothetical protein